MAFVRIAYESQCCATRENVRNLLVLNYKSADLNQLSYAGFPYTKAVFSGLIKSSSKPISQTVLRRGPKFHGLLLPHERWLGPLGAGVVATDTVHRLNW